MALVHSYRLTPKGQACIDVVESGELTTGSLSRYLHDMLLTCGSGIWLDQLVRFVPPHSLEQSLQALVTLELVERDGPQANAPRASSRSVRRSSTASSPTENRTRTPLYGQAPSRELRIDAIS
jgi:hypothetical protein